MAPGNTSKREKETVKAVAAAAALARAAEQASWEETDKRLVAKQQRQEEREAKADAKSAAKLERRALEQTEEAVLTKKEVPKKITQAEIARRHALAAALAPKPKAKMIAKTQVVPQPKLEPNRNREMDVLEASSIDAAVAVLDSMDKGRESTGGISFAEFEKRVFEELRAEKPGMKMSQMQEHARKQWTRSPENPSRGG